MIACNCQCLRTNTIVTPSRRAPRLRGRRDGLDGQLVQAFCPFSWTRSSERSITSNEMLAPFFHYRLLPNVVDFDSVVSIS